MWLFFAVFCSLFEALKDVFSKKSLIHVDEYILLWFSRVVNVLMLLPLFFFFPVPQLDKQALWALLISGSINVAAVLLYFKAIKLGDLSLVLPMLTFSPLFLMITSPLIVGEFPKFFGLIGIIFIVCGSYILNIKSLRQGLFSPFSSLFKEKGTRYMLFVALLWSVSSNFDKIGALHSSVLFWVVAVNGFIALVLSPLMVFKLKPALHLIRRHKKEMILSGVFLSLANMFQMTAISMALVAYVISIKRMSALWGAIFGYLIFKEKGLKERFAGAIIMIMGVILISFS